MNFSERKAQAIAKWERRVLIDYITRNSYIITKAAKAAGLNRSNFLRLMRKHGVTKDAVRNLEIQST